MPKPLSVRRLMLAASLLFAWSTPAVGAEFTRRSLTCMLGLGAFGAVGGLAEPFPVRHRPEPKNAPEIEFTFVTKLLATTTATLPGFAVNLAVAKVMDAVRDFKRDVDALPPTDSPTYVDTVVKTQLVLLATLTMAVFSPIEIGNAGVASSHSLIDMATDHPLRLTLMTSVIAPIFEESCFRLLPRAVFGKSWVTGTAASALFAAGHNWHGGKFLTTMVPLPQFVSGMFFWYLLRERGFDHAVIAHAATNSAISVLGLLAPRL